MVRLQLPCTSATGAEALPGFSPTVLCVPSEPLFPQGLSIEDPPTHSFPCFPQISPHLASLTADQTLGISGLKLFGRFPARCLLIVHPVPTSLRTAASPRGSSQYNLPLPLPASESSLSSSTQPQPQRKNRAALC